MYPKNVYSKCCPPKKKFAKKSQRYFSNGLETYALKPSGPGDTSEQENYYKIGYLENRVPKGLKAVFFRKSLKLNL